MAEVRILTIHAERISIGKGDNWPITWADDGHQYTVYCDGEGFGGGSGKGSMSLARIVGDPPDFEGENMSSPTGHRTGGGPKGRKASGLLMVDGVLYMWGPWHTVKEIPFFMPAQPPPWSPFCFTVTTIQRAEVLNYAKRRISRLAKR